MRMRTRSRSLIRGGQVPSLMFQVIYGLPPMFIDDCHADCDANKAPDPTSVYVSDEAQQDEIWNAAVRQIETTLGTFRVAVSLNWIGCSKSQVIEECDGLLASYASIRERAPSFDSHRPDVVLSMRGPIQHPKYLFHPPPMTGTRLA